MAMEQVAVPTEHPEVTRLKEQLRVTEEWAEEMAARARRAEGDSESAWRRRLVPVDDLPGVMRHGLSDEVVVSGRAWRAWRGERSQREMHLGDECGRLLKRAEDAERARDKAEAALARRGRR